MLDRFPAQPAAAALREPATSMVRKGRLIGTTRAAEKPLDAFWPSAAPNPSRPGRSEAGWSRPRQSRSGPQRALALARMNADPTYTNGPGDSASACRLREAVGAGDQGAVRAPQRDDVSGGRRCPLVEPPRWGLVQVPEDHLADLAARSPPLAARDAVVAAFLYRCHANPLSLSR